ncbi:MAG: iron ABC transporter permease [Caldisericia bacterium]|jgi:iron complex transport system permease protein|nr:iron ABC transporter permease [Caldisericia bacterium]
MREKIFIIIIIFLLIISIFLSLSFGAKRYTFQEIINFIFNFKNSDELFVKIRFPRVFASLFVGASLSIAGLLSQTLFLNPLADPFLFGISSGANFFVTLSLFLGLDALFKFSLSFFSFLGALFSVSIIYLISKIKGKITPLNLLLSGIAINYLFSSLSTFLIIWGRDVLNKSVFWSLTGFSNVDMNKFLFLVLIFIPSFITSIFLSFNLDVYSLGEDQAKTLGINTNLLKTLTLILISILTGISVYVSGIIGFVGLMVPNILREIFGLKHIKLLFLSIFFGGLLLTLSDLFGRAIFYPNEIPVATITSFLGVPFFLYVLWKEKVF